MRGGDLTVGARGGGSSGWTGGRIIPGPPVSAFLHHGFRTPRAPDRRMAQIGATGATAASRLAPPGRSALGDGLDRCGADPANA